MSGITESYANDKKVLTATFPTQGGATLAAKRLAEMEKEGLIQQIPLRQAYIDLLRKRVDVDAIRSAQLRVGYDAMFGVYGNMLERGVIDPVKVTRSALENAASIATLILTTESLITDIPEPPGRQGRPSGRGPRCSRCARSGQIGVGGRAALERCQEGT